MNVVFFVVLFVSIFVAHGCFFGRTVNKYVRERATFKCHKIPRPSTFSKRGSPNKFLSCLLTLVMPKDDSNLFRRRRDIEEDALLHISVSASQIDVIEKEEHILLTVLQEKLGGGNVNVVVVDVRTAAGDREKRSVDDDEMNESAFEIFYDNDDGREDAWEDEDHIEMDGEMTTGQDGGTKIRVTRAVKKGGGKIKTTTKKPTTTKKTTKTTTTSTTPKTTKGTTTSTTPKTTTTTTTTTTTPKPTTVAPGSGKAKNNSMGAEKNSNSTSPSKGKEGDKQEKSEGSEVSKDVPDLAVPEIPAKADPAAVMEDKKESTPDSPKTDTPNNKAPEPSSKQGNSTIPKPRNETERTGKKQGHGTGQVEKPNPAVGTKTLPAVIPDLNLPKWPNLSAWVSIIGGVGASALAAFAFFCTPVRRCLLASFGCNRCKNHTPPTQQIPMRNM